jgi:hypothetical protein
VSGVSSVRCDEARVEAPYHFRACALSDSRKGNMRVLFSGTSCFWLSRDAVLLARELGAAWATPEHIPVRGEEGCWIDDDRDEEYSFPDLVPRHDPVLLELHARLGDAMSTGARVLVAEIPDDVTYSISSYNSEWIAEVHRIWGAEYLEGVLSQTVYCFSKNSTYEELQQRYNLR